MRLGSLQEEGANDSLLELQDYWQSDETVIAAILPNSTPHPDPDPGQFVSIQAQQCHTKWSLFRQISQMCCRDKIIQGLLNSLRCWKNENECYE